MAVDINAAAAAALAQGNQQLADYQSKANAGREKYNQYQKEAEAANKQVQSYTDYMKGEGSADNQYNKAFTTKKNELGYDEDQMLGARANLNQATGALSAYSDFANTAASKWGLNAGGFAAANAGALGGLNNNIASNQGVVNSLSDLYKTAQTGANEFTGTVIQGEHETLAGLQSVYTNAANMRDDAQSTMTFYDDLASKQGGLNASQQAYYAQAKQAYASAQQAMAQASLLIAQGEDQRLKNQQTVNYMNTQQYKDYLAGKIDVNGKPIAKTAAPSTPTTNASKPAQNNGDWFTPGNSWNTFTGTLHNAPSISNTLTGIGALGAAGISGIGKGISSIWR